MKISIIVTCYNLEKEIQKCLESCINQTYGDLDIIVVDDGSKDNSVHVINKYEYMDNRVRCLTQKNQGPSAARNNGMDVALGEYIMFVDGDDYIGANYVENMVTAIKKNEDMVIAGLRYIYPNGNFKIIDGIIFECEFENLIKDYYADLIRTRLIFGPVNKLYKKSLLDEFNIKFNESIKIREDGLFVLNVIEKAKTFIGIENSEYFYIQHKMNGSLISKFQEKEKEINRLFFCKMVDLIGFNNMTSKDIAAIMPTYLNMDISSIRKYYNSENPDFKSGIKYIKEILQNETYKVARKKYAAVNMKGAMKYYRPALLFHLINRYKTIK